MFCLLLLLRALILRIHNGDIMKKCTKCHEIKDLSCFGIDRRTMDGHKFQCKKCVNDFARSREKKKILVTCAGCGETKQVDYYSNRHNKTGFCINCMSKHTLSGVKRPEVTGSNSKRWKGGEYTSSDGYKMVKCDGHLHPSGRVKYKREHILVMEKHLGRELQTQRGHMGEQIHHIDGDKLNNDISNLLLCSDTRDHKKVDCQLHDLAFELVKKQVIGFDFDTRTYFINWGRISCQLDQTQLS